MLRQGLNSPKQLGEFQCRLPGAGAEGEVAPHVERLHLQSAIPCKMSQAQIAQRGTRVRRLLRGMDCNENNVRLNLQQGFFRNRFIASIVGKDIDSASQLNEPVGLGPETGSHRQTGVAQEKDHPGRHSACAYGSRSIEVAFDPLPELFGSLLFPEHAPQQMDGGSQAFTAVRIGNNFKRNRARFKLPDCSRRTNPGTRQDSCGPQTENTFCTERTYVAYLRKAVDPGGYWLDESTATTWSPAPSAKVISVTGPPMQTSRSSATSAEDRNSNKKNPTQDVRAFLGIPWKLSRTISTADMILGLDLTMEKWNDTET